MSHNAQWINEVQKSTTFRPKLKTQNIQSIRRYSEKKLEAIQRIPTVARDGRKEASHVSELKQMLQNTCLRAGSNMPRIGLSDSAEHNSTWLGSLWKISW